VALKAAKARGVKLGNPNGARAFGNAGGYKAAVGSLKAKADARARDIEPIVANIRSAGATTLVAIAAELNARKIKTRTPARCGICWGASKDHQADPGYVAKGSTRQ